VPTTRLAPRKTPVQRRAVETRDRILDAAARVFSRHGYAAGTTNRIAEEAGLSVGSLYQYFPNKDAILVELVRRHIAAGVAAVRECLDTAVDAAAARDGGLDVDALVGAVVDAAIAVHRDDPGLHQVLFEESPRPPEVLAELRTMESALVERAAALLAAAPGVRVADPVLAARVAVVTVESLVHRVVATRDPQVDLAAFRDELVRLVAGYLRGSGPPT
jgi:AcrR family transcriptional regulator